MEHSLIYLDHSATTPVDPAVVEAMMPYWTNSYGNPSSSHTFGRQAQLGLETARRTIAQLIHAQPSEIIFTGCGSESDNLALRGVMWAARQNGRGNHLITSVIEHEAILATAKQLRDQFGFELTLVGVDQYGRVNPDEIAAAMRPNTVLVSIMAANNEVGTIQPIEEIGTIAHENGALFHTDAVQAAAYQKWDMSKLPIDLMSLAPHKFYGPKGIGILYLHKDVKLMPMQTGGGHENGRRAGTANVPLAVGAAKALELTISQLETHVKHYRLLRDQLIAGILEAFSEDQCQLTGHPTERLPHHASFAFKGLNGNDMLMHLDLIGIAASSGSACSTGNPEPSSILEAIGLADSWTRGGLRLTIGRSNTVAEIEYTIDKLPEALQKLQLFMASYR